MQAIEERSNHLTLSLILIEVRVKTSARPTDKPNVKDEPHEV